MPQPESTFSLGHWLSCGELGHPVEKPRIHCGKARLAIELDTPRLFGQHQATAVRQVTESLSDGREVCFSLGHLVIHCLRLGLSF